MAVLCMSCTRMCSPIYGLGAHLKANDDHKSTPGQPPASASQINTNKEIVHHI